MPLKQIGYPVNVIIFSLQTLNNKVCIIVITCNGFLKYPKAFSVEVSQETLAPRKQVNKSAFFPLKVMKYLLAFKGKMKNKSIFQNIIFSWKSYLANKFWQNDLGIVMFTIVLSRVRLLSLGVKHQNLREKQSCRLLELWKAALVKMGVLFWPNYKHVYNPGT